MIPLVLVHGFLGGSAQWQGQKMYFRGKPDLITVDLPGFGLNHHLPPLARIGDMADWVLATLRERGLGRYHLLGHSMGGMVVQEMARRVPASLASLILYSTGSIGVLPGRFETIETSKARAFADGAAATARRICATWFLRGESDPAYAGCASIAEAASPQAIAAGLDAMQGWRGAETLDRITAPTRLIWGDQDRTYPWPQIETLWRGIPDATLCVLPDCAHAVHLEKPDLFNAVLADHVMT